MNNSILFKQAHKMTKITIKPNETYRYKFGQWLIFLKTGVTNVLGITNINQSVCYVPILEYDKAYHDRIGYNRLIRTSYSLKPPMTINKTYHGTIGNSVQSWYINKYLFNLMKFVCTNPLSLIVIFLVVLFTLILK